LIILDTDVIAVLMRPTPAEHHVIAWLDSVPRSELATTSVNYAEALYGVEKLYRGQRKQSLYVALHRVIRAAFDGRIMPFDSQAAREYAILISERRRAGRPILELDAQIAAIARARKMPLATRDADFAECGVTVINPWDHAA
jgi:hypothetical protein